MKINVMELFFRHQKSNAASLLRLQAICRNVKNFRNFIPSWHRHPPGCLLFLGINRFRHQTSDRRGGQSG
ncbi:hypothetical protein F7D03_00445 [Escherichia coli]|nr:hypothetical protein F7D03_00445 [Escherichia coli]